MLEAVGDVLSEELSEEESVTDEFSSEVTDEVPLLLCESAEVLFAVHAASESAIITADKAAEIFMYFFAISVSFQIRREFICVFYHKG